jgi:predicted Zn-dependent protease
MPCFLRRKIRKAKNLADLPTGSLAVARAHAARLLAAEPALAEAQCREILRLAPQDAQTLQLLGLALAAGGKPRPAIQAVARAVALDRGLTGGWRALGDQFGLAGDSDAANDAYARHIQASVNDPQLQAAATALVGNRLAVAERLLRPFLKTHPTDVAAIRMLAEVGARLGRLGDAEKLLARCLALAPGFTAARHNYALVLHRQMKSAEALVEADLLLRHEPQNPSYRALKAAILGRVGEYHAALELYDSLLKEFPLLPKGWMSYGHTLKTVGREKDSIAAYRRALALQSGLGEAWWSLANLKTFGFSGADVAAMRDALAREGLSEEDRLHLDFALAKALEDAGFYAESFAHYRSANALRRAQIVYSADDNSAQIHRAMQFYSREFFAARAGQGCPAPDPIFIVGLPRSGSTLLEQILSSHSEVEGTMELPDITAMARRLDIESPYPECLGRFDAAALRSLGEEYLLRTQIQRKRGRTFFIDKMPNNFLHLGFIHLIMPNAKIIDARRHPLGCCLSGYKQHFARGQNFTYNLAELGRYYADYAALMAHFDLVLPGRVHRVFYEQMIAEPERELRRLLAYCGLPFQESCLRFYENDRAVRTASSQQVRQPLFTDAALHWRNFEPWLEPLKTALGTALEAYPAFPSVREAAED